MAMTDIENGLGRPLNAMPVDIGQMKSDILRMIRVGYAVDEVLEGLRNKASRLGRTTVRDLLVDLDSVVSDEASVARDVMSNFAMKQIAEIDRELHGILS